jgi:predicted unusual protein kinase regulating ubiquinone biosynthesis (AarF/ABC1/UbiB family)
MAEERRESTLRSRLTRYARVGGAVGGLAARLGAEHFFGIPLDRAAHAGQLRQALGGLKGPLMKVAQMLSTIPEALPAEYVVELAHLQANAPPMGWLFVKRRMSNELGPNWEERFQSFEPEAAAAASLGQVHRARAPDGRRLACKLQYPDMQAIVDADLRQLRLVFAIYRQIDPAIDTRNILAEIAERLHEELDYQREARHIALYGEMLRDVPDVHVPEILPELCGSRLLTMTWLEGKPLLEFAKAPLDTRNVIAENLFRAWYVPFYRYGVLHGDPHLGNYSVRPSGAINLLDFGCIRVFHAKFVKGVIDLYWAIQRSDQELAISAYETWGFKGLTREMIETLNLWAEFVYSPLLEDRPRQIQEKDSGGLYGREVAARVHRRLRELGGVAPPREFLLMDRAAIGLGGVFLHLRAKINWHRLFHDLIRDFDMAALGLRQVKALKAAGLPPVRH